MKGVVICLSILSALVWGYNIGSLTPHVYTDKRVIKEICDASHKNPTADWNDACGVAQSVSGINYNTSELASKGEL